MNTITKSRHWVAALVASAGLLVGGRAFAFSSTCYVNFPFSPFHCDTQPVFPNPWTHTINMYINYPFTTYTMRDLGNNHVIRQGVTGGGWHDETIGGLYNDEQGYGLACDAKTYSTCELNNN